MYSVAMIINQVTGFVTTQIRITKFYKCVSNFFHGDKYDEIIYSHVVACRQTLKNMAKEKDLVPKFLIMSKENLLENDLPSPPWEKASNNLGKTAA